MPNGRRAVRSGVARRNAKLAEVRSPACRRPVVREPVPGGRSPLDWRPGLQLASGRSPTLIWTVVGGCDHGEVVGGSDHGQRHQSHRAARALRRRIADSERMTDMPSGSVITCRTSRHAGALSAYSVARPRWDKANLPLLSQLNAADSPPPELFPECKNLLSACPLPVPAWMVNQRIGALRRLSFVGACDVRSYR